MAWFMTALIISLNFILKILEFLIRSIYKGDSHVNMSREYQSK